MKKKPGRSRGRIRITGGQWRSRQLSVLAMRDLRPSADRSRETLFNWLGQSLDGDYVLDLFAGSGALGIEALSRGAACVHFVEKHPRIAQGIRDNLAQLTAETERFVVIQQSAQQWLAQPRRAYDLILIDPPFRKPELAEQALALIHANGLLAPHGWVYLEMPEQLAQPEGLTLHKQQVSGEAVCCLYQAHLTSQQRNRALTQR